VKTVDTRRKLFDVVALDKAIQTQFLINTFFILLAWTSPKHRAAGHKNAEIKTSHLQNSNGQKKTKDEPHYLSTCQQVQ